MRRAKMSDNYFFVKKLSNSKRGRPRPASPPTATISTTLNSTMTIDYHRTDWFDKRGRIRPSRIRPHTLLHSPNSHSIKSPLP